jgi:2-oxoglutarate dehydrogenase E2 component (dihydrolipoamide succinyltransferase)
MIEIKIPNLGESVSEATIARWLKQEGDAVQMNDPLVELETDKVTLEINAPESGILQKIIALQGTAIKVGGIIAELEAGAAPQVKKTDSKPVEKKEAVGEKTEEEKPLSPAVQKWVSDNNLNPIEIPTTGPGGRITKGDVMDFMSGSNDASLEKKAPQVEASSSPKPTEAPLLALKPTASSNRQEERVKMSRLRQRIAERLKSAQNTAAILTTFNEIDMSALTHLRNTYKEAFEKRHGAKLGFMSFFVKACIQALGEFPAVNATIEGDEIVYKNYYDIGVAVGTEQGLIVPIIRQAETLSLADIEKRIADFGARARSGKISLDDLTGGTFTLSNGGVYGSLMSTPILNPPQSGILGMHKVQKRAVVVGDQIVIRPMMYVALSYDHRIVDGKEAVSFLVRVKDCLEDPSRLILGL